MASVNASSGLAVAGNQKLARVPGMMYSKGRRFLSFSLSSRFRKQKRHGGVKPAQTSAWSHKSDSGD